MAALEVFPIVQIDPIYSVKLIGWDNEAFVYELIYYLLLNLLILCVDPWNYLIDVAGVSQEIDSARKHLALFEEFYCLIGHKA